MDARLRECPPRNQFYNSIVSNFHKYLKLIGSLEIKLIALKQDIILYFSNVLIEIELDSSMGKIHNSRPLSQIMLLSAGNYEIINLTLPTSQPI